MARLDYSLALDILINRGLKPSRVRLASGQVCVVHNVAWGWDIGDEVAHITTNVSPSPEVVHDIDCFRADEIAVIEDLESNQTLFERSDSASEQQD